MNINYYTKKQLSEVPLHEFVGDLDLRWERMNGLVDNILSQYRNPKILDMALGSGHDSIFLIKKKHNVVSNEIDNYSIKISVKKAEEAGVKLIIRNAFWEKMDKSEEYAPGEFDFVFSLGNSFPNYLLDVVAREKALKNFWMILKPGGTLLFDSRNFDYILNNAREILIDPENNFRYLYFTTYLNKAIKAFPVSISSDKVRFRWVNIQDGAYAELDLWPSKIANVTDLIRHTLGDVQFDIYYDYFKEKPEHFDFVQYVLKKPT